MSSVIISGDVSGSITLQAPSAAGSTVLTLPATSGTIALTSGGGSPSFTTVTATTVATSNLTIGGTALGAGNASIMKNRIINGAMVIDQRNAGASIAGTSGLYPLDRFLYAATQSSKGTLQQNQGSVTLSAGFTNYLGFTTASSGYSVLTGDTFYIAQRIEGYNVSDLGWGTASAKTVTLSFQVYSSLTGTFGGSLFNSTGDRSYPFSYTVSSANTWTQISVTITGDTTGTWLKTNGIGIQVGFGLGAGATYSGTANTWASTLYTQPTGTVSVVGTANATFYITGVQLEVGSSATGFEYRMYQQELALCQRYLPAINMTNSYYGGGQWYSSASGTVSLAFPVTARVAPTGYTTTTGSLQFFAPNGGVASGTVIFFTASQYAMVFNNATSSGNTAGYAATMGGTTALTILPTGCEL